MKKYILNSAVITDFGVYSYVQVSPAYAQCWYKHGEKPISTIGYEETAAVLSELLGHPVEVNRVTIKMKVDDEALVFRIVLPPGSKRIDPKDKGRIKNIIEKGQWELGLLRRLR